MASVHYAHPLGDPDELAALYAAGALTPDERLRFEEHLDAGCAACRAALRQFDPVAAALALAVEPVTPDPGVRAALLGRVAGRGGRPGDSSPLRRQVEGAAQDQGMILRRAGEAVWQPSEVEGVSIRVLFVDRANNRFAALVRMAPGTSYPCHTHGGPEECLVLEGELRVGDEVMRPGDYQRAPAGSRHGVQSTGGGCLLFITSSLTDVFD